MYLNIVSMVVGLSFLRNEAKSLLESLQMEVDLLILLLLAKGFYCNFLVKSLNYFSLANCLQFCSSVLFLGVFLEFLTLMPPGGQYIPFRQAITQMLRKALDNHSFFYHESISDLFLDA